MPSRRRSLLICLMRVETPMKGPREARLHASYATVSRAAASTPSLRDIAAWAQGEELAAR
jgi:hypothetical protein